MLQSEIIDKLSDIYFDSDLKKKHPKNDLVFNLAKEDYANYVEWLRNEGLCLIVNEKTLTFRGMKVKETDGTSEIILNNVNKG